jgi:protease-4
MHARSSLPMVLLALTACGSKPSKLDPSVETARMPKSAPVAAAADDPWASPAPAKSADDNKGNAGGGGGGVMGLLGNLEKVMEGLKKPGPYEAPRSSPTYKEDEPHWGILELGGGLVEKRGFSLLGGGGGTELRQLTERLRELAKDSRLSGLLLRVDNLGGSLPDLAELRAALHDVKKAKKGLVCHVEDAANATYPCCRRATASGSHRSAASRSPGPRRCRCT